MSNRDRSPVRSYRTRLPVVKATDPKRTSIGPATRQEARELVRAALGGDQLLTNLRELYGIGKDQFVTQGDYYGMTVDQCVEVIAKELWMSPKKKFFQADLRLVAIACSLLFIPDTAGMGLFVALVNFERPWDNTANWEYVVARLCDSFYPVADTIRALNYAEAIFSSQEHTMSPEQVRSKLDLDVLRDLLNGKAEREHDSAAKQKLRNSYSYATTFAVKWGIYDATELSRQAHLLEIELKTSRDLLLPALRLALETSRTSSSTAQHLDSAMKEASKLHKEKAWTTAELQALLDLNNRDPFRTHDFKPKFISLFLADMTAERTTPCTLTRAQCYENAEDLPFVLYTE